MDIDYKNIKYAELININGNHLFSIVINESKDQQNEYDIFMDICQSTEKLFKEIYRDNKLLEKFKKIGIYEAVKIVKQESFEINQILMSVDKPYNHTFQSLKRNDKVNDLDDWRTEARLPRYFSRLRIFALKIDENFFVIVGGGIKTEDKTQDHILTNESLERLNILMDYYINKLNLQGSDDFMSVFEGDIRNG